MRDFDKDLDLHPSEWSTTGRRTPEPEGLGTVGWVTLIATLGGISIANYGWPSRGIGDDICLVLFLAFCWWNYR